MVKKERGITLIALVITIIVLLILAGITIAALSGENGILIRATEATEKTERASAKERVELEVLGSYGEDGKIDTSLLDENLRNIQGIEIEEPITSLPTTVGLDGKNIIIRKDGTVVVSDWKQNGYEITNGKITLRVGDTVLNYNETTESTEIETTESGHTDSQMLTTENLGWRILGIGENGGLELISDNATTATVTLAGETGYLNAEDILNRVCDELYGKGQHAEGGRSLKAEDVNKLANYNPETDSEYGYGDLYKFRFDTNANCIQYSISTDNGMTWGEWKKQPGEYEQIFRLPGSTETISKDNPKTSEEIKNLYYVYEIATKINDMNILKMIINGTGESNISYWLATETNSCVVGLAGFGMHTVLSGLLTEIDITGELYNCTNINLTKTHCIRPVITLQSDIQLEGNSEDGWTIK